MKTDLELLLVIGAITADQRADIIKKYDEYEKSKSPDRGLKMKELRDILDSSVIINSAMLDIVTALKVLRSYEIDLVKMGKIIEKDKIENELLMKAVVKYNRRR